LKEIFIKNVRFYEDSKLHTLYIKDGIVEDVDGTVSKRDFVFDAEKRILLPAFVNSHAHLGRALTLTYAEPNKSGTLLEGVLKTQEVAKKITQEELEQRLFKVGRLLFANGVTRVRTHEPIIGGLLDKMLVAREKIKNLLDLQIVAFPNNGVFQVGIENFEKALERGADVVGFAPHFEKSFEEGLQSIKHVFELAKKYNKLVDGHVDETDDPNSRFAEAVATEALRRDWGNRTTISHITASHSYENWYFHKLALLFKEAAVNIVSNPVVSTFLQGRYDNYPKRRGVARIKELLKAGVNVSLGTDNIADHVFPLGDGNMLRVLQQAFLIDLWVYEDIFGSLRLITYNAAKTMNVQNYGVKIGEKAELVVLNAKSEYEAIRAALPPALVIKGENVCQNIFESKINDTRAEDIFTDLVFD
jgi:cytosine deaminase